MTFRITVLGLSVAVLLAGGCAKNDPLKGSLAGHNYLRVANKEIENAPQADPPKILPKTHYAAGRLFESHGQLGKAIEQYRKAAATQRDFAEAHHRLGRALYLAGQHDEAVNALARAVELDPDNAAFRNDLSFELMYHEEWGAAERHLRKAIALQSGFARAHINLGLVLGRTGRFDEALESFRAVLPEADAQYNLGLMFRGQKRYADAARAFRRVLETNPEFSAARVQLDQLAVYPDAAPPAPVGQLAGAEQTTNQRPAAHEAAEPPGRRREASLAEEAGTPQAPDEAVARRASRTAGKPSDADPMAWAAEVSAALERAGRRTARVGRSERALPAVEPTARPKRYAGRPAEGVALNVKRDGESVGPRGGFAPGLEGRRQAEQADSVEAPELTAQWEGMEITLRGLREILANDADCLGEAVAGAGPSANSDQEQRANADQPLRAAGNARGKPAVPAGDARSKPPAVGRAGGRANTVVVDGLPLGPMDLRPSKTVRVMGPPFEADPVRRVRTVAHRPLDLGSRGTVRPDDWREAFADLALLAGITRNDFMCFRESQAERVAGDGGEFQERIRGGREVDSDELQQPAPFPRQPAQGGPVMGAPPTRPPPASLRHAPD